MTTTTMSLLLVKEKNYFHKADWSKFVGAKTSWQNNPITEELGKPEGSFFVIRWGEETTQEPTYLYKRIYK